MRLIVFHKLRLLLPSLVQNLWAAVCLMKSLIFDGSLHHLKSFGLGASGCFRPLQLLFRNVEALVYRLQYLGVLATLSDRSHVLCSLSLG